MATDTEFQTHNVTFLLINYNRKRKGNFMIEKQKYAHAKTYRVSSYRECLSTCETIRKRSNAYAIIEFEKPLEIEGRTSFPYSNFYLKGNGSKFVSNSAGKYTDKDNRELTTWRTATFSSYGDNCIFEDFIFENRACLPEKNGQAVALSCFSNNCLFINCKIVSSQDTLFIGPLPDDLIFRYTDFIPERERLIEGNLHNYFYSCYIEGGIDFIFGAGQASFYKCQIDSEEDNRFSTSFVSAPAHSMKDEFGFHFYKCNFTSRTIFQQRVYLARPWRDFGKCFFNSCKYGKHISSEGFINWELTQRQLTCRFLEYPRQKSRVSFAKEVDDVSKLKQYVKDIRNLEKLD